MSKDEIKSLLKLVDIFCFQLYDKIPLFKPFYKFDIFFDRLTDIHTDKKSGKDRLKAYQTLLELFVEIPQCKDLCQFLTLFFLAFLVFRG